MKSFFFLFSLLIINFYYSQQTEGLRVIREKYAPEFENIEVKYKNIPTKRLSKKELQELSQKKDQEIFDLEFKRNEEYLIELANIQSNKSVINFDPKTVQPLDEKGEVTAEYPSGINGFKKEVIDNFYAGTIDAKGNIRTELVFIIERDGTIVDVKASGENENFNKQAELAIYLTTGKWQGARVDGLPTRYRMRLPLNLNFN